MATIPDSARELLTTGPLATVVTLNADGTPHVSHAWAGIEGDEFVFATFTDQHKLENLRRDSRVTLSFLQKEHHGEGLHPYLAVRGRARLSEGGALDVMDRLAEYYIGPGAKFWARDVPAGFVTQVTVEKIYGIGPWSPSPIG
jgi:PPOX class probable F420-dependent enzyme